MQKSRKEAFDLIDELGAPEYLKTLVGEAADLLIDAIDCLGIKLNFEFVRAGVVIQDLCHPGSSSRQYRSKILCRTCKTYLPVHTSTNKLLRPIL